MIDLKALMIDSRRITVEHGFETGWHNFAEKIALIHSELSEALEEYRAGRRDTYYDTVTCKPEGIAVELADAIIRIADLAEACELDLELAILEKQAYNESRPYKHGKVI